MEIRGCVLGVGSALRCGVRVPLTRRPGGWVSACLPRGPAQRVTSTLMGGDAQGHAMVTATPSHSSTGTTQEICALLCVP